MISAYNVNYPMNIKPLNFKGTIDISNIEGKFYKHESSFLRNFPTLEFTKNYILENFPKGTQISEFGCSKGYKPYSLMVLLSKHNKDKKYKITGYDIAPDVIDKAREGKLLVEFDCGNEVIFFNPKCSEGQKLPVEDLLKDFEGHFEQIPCDQNNIFLKVKPQDIVDFQVGDINNIDGIINQDSSGVIIFQNALYHLLSDQFRLGYKSDVPQEVESLIGKIHQLLPKNGLFVMGSLPYDHICGKSKLRFEYEHGEKKEIFDTSPIHDVLRKTGFEPVFYEKSWDDVYYPSAWKKVALKQNEAVPADVFMAFYAPQLSKKYTP